MSLTVENLGVQHTVLHVAIEPETYLPIFEKKCKEKNKEVAIKGFRKGTNPLGLFKKIYGNHILSETIKDLSDKELADYSEQNNLRYFASPLLIHDDTQDINYTDTEKTYTLSLEFALKPQIDLSVLYNPEHEFVRYLPQITDAELEEQIELIKKSYGTVSDLTEADTIEPNDIIYLQTQETDEAGNILEGGISHTTPVIPDLLKSGAEKDALLNLKLHESINLNIFDLFDLKREEVAKQMLDVKENTENLPDTYKITITQVRRRIPAELNEDLFIQIFPDTEITTLEAFKAKLTEVINANYEQEGYGLLHKQLRITIPHILAPYLPELFVRKLLNYRSNYAYAEDNKWNASKKYIFEEFQWQLIREELTDKFNVKVEDYEIDDAIIYEWHLELKKRYNLELPHEMLEKYAKKDLENQERRTLVYHNLQDYHGINALIPNLPVKEQVVTIEEFKKNREEFDRAEDEAISYTEEA